MTNPWQSKPYNQKAVTHLIVNPKRGLHVTLQLAATFACSWDLPISDENGLLVHRLQLPRLPVGFTWTLDEDLAPRHTVEIFASTYETAGEDYRPISVFLTKGYNVRYK